MQWLLVYSKDFYYITHSKIFLQLQDGSFIKCEDTLPSYWNIAECSVLPGIVLQWEATGHFRENGICPGFTAFEKSNQKRRTCSLAHLQLILFYSFFLQRGWARIKLDLLVLGTYHCTEVFIHLSLSIYWWSYLIFICLILFILNVIYPAEFFFLIIY